MKTKIFESKEPISRVRPDKRIVIDEKTEPNNQANKPLEWIIFIAIEHNQEQNKLHTHDPEQPVPIEKIEDNCIT